MSLRYAIELRDLTKSYRVYHKPEGFAASLRGLFHRKYDTVEAVQGVSLTIEPGEFVAFLGPNGAGKTTTLKLLSGIVTPTSGTATVLGYVPWERRNEFRRRFALVMGQKNQLWWDLPAVETFQLFRHLYRIESPRFERTRDELAEMLGVVPLLERPVRELSLGERMKMELIAALLHDPEVLFLDEPTIGLDVLAQETVRNFLREYQTLRRTTILLTSHYMKDVKDLCQRIVVMGAGRILSDSTLRELMVRLGNHRVVAFRLPEGRQPPTNAGVALPSSSPYYRWKIPCEALTPLLRELTGPCDATDITVEEPPLESLFAELFATATVSATSLSLCDEIRFSG